jgi:hypothetical protein
MDRAGQIPDALVDGFDKLRNRPSLQ